MKRIHYIFALVLISGVLFTAQSQYLRQNFTLPLLSGNESNGTVISNAAVTSDANYVSSPAADSHFTYLSTNNALAKIGINGTDGVMSLARYGSGTVYVVRNTNFDGPPNALKVSFDFNADSTGGTSNTAIEVMIGQNFPNSNSAPATGNKFALFYIAPKSPTGKPGTWGVTPVSATPASSYSSVQKIVWVLNQSGADKIYTAPNGATDTVANNKYDLWVGNTREFNDQAATTDTAKMMNFEIRIAGGNGLYSIDNLLIENIPAPGAVPTVTTAAISNISFATATGGGEVTSAGSDTIIARGVCWSTSQNPTTADSKTNDGFGTGVFVSSITGLIANTTYYVRAYATNSVGTAYGQEVSFTTSTAPPNITLSSLNPAVPAGNVNLGTVKHPVYKFDLAVTTANAQLTQVDFTTAGTYVASDVTKFQLWFNSADQFANAVQLGADITTALGPGAHSFTGLTQSIPAASTGYLWITADIPVNAESGHTLSVNALTTADLTFASGNKSGTAYAGGAQTIIGGSLPTDHFRSLISGNWSSASTWESSSDLVNWILATRSPDSSSASIKIVAGDTVTVTASVIVDAVTVDSGAVVIVNGSPVVLTIANGAADVDMLVKGKLMVTGTAIASPGPYSVSLSTDAVLRFAPSGVYEHNQNAGAIPVSVWDNGSTIMFTGITANSPANGNQNFYNIIWNNPAQTANLNLGWNGNTIGGDITVVNTNTGRWQLCAPAAGNTSTVTIMGNVTLQAGNLTTNGTGNANTTIIINHYGDINVSGGNFSISRGTQGGTGTSTWFMHSGNVVMANCTTQNSNTTPNGAKFVFTGNDPQAFTATNVTYSGGGFPILVDSGAVLNLGSSVLGGAANFAVYPTGRINTALPEGFNGNLLNTGTITLSPEASYGYNGTVAQVTGSMLPAEVYGLSINNPAGVTLSANQLVTGWVQVNSGKLYLDGKTLTLGTSAVLSETPGNTVTGLAGKIVTTRDLNAPAFENVGGMGAMINSGANLGTTLIERYHVYGTGLGNRGIRRMYNISPANNTGLNATLRFYYDETELDSIPEANLVMFRSPDGTNNTWVKVGGTLNAASNYVEAAGINSFSYWTLGDNFAQIPVELTSFAVTVQKNKATLRWETATETNNKGFEVERSSSDGWLVIGFVAGAGNKSTVTSYSFTDNEKLTGKYSYRLKQIDFDGTVSYSKSVEADFVLPTEFALNQNYPNPFNPATTIEFQLPADSDVELVVFDALGNQVATLLKGNMSAGYHTLNANLSNLSSGIYYYRMSAGSFVDIKKMILMK